MNSNIQTLNGGGVKFDKVLFFGHSYKKLLLFLIKEEVFYVKLSSYLVIVTTL